MDDFPRSMVEHDIPLIFITGLGTYENGSAPIEDLSGAVRIAATSSEVSGDRAQLLLEQLFRLDGTECKLNRTALPGPSERVKYRMRAVGRVGETRAWRHHA